MKSCAEAGLRGNVKLTRTKVIFVRNTKITLVRVFGVFGRKGTILSSITNLLDWLPGRFPSKTKFFDT
jgi:hypothetical protein